MDDLFRILGVLSRVASNAFFVIGEYAVVTARRSGLTPCARRPARRHDYALRRLDDVRHLHVIWFAAWIGFGVESYPYGLLAMIVSLEAIFLSTFVMISQNRAAAKQQGLADQEWHTVQEEDQQNRQLLALSNQILTLTKEVHAFAAAARGDGVISPPVPPGAGGR